MANMTVLTEHTVKGAGFCNNGQSADCSTAQTLVPAVSGKSHYIKSITIQCVAAIDVQIQDNTGTPIVLIGGLEFVATSGSPVAIDFLNPIKVASGKQIDVKASGAGKIAAVIQGFTE